jgi:hypothetical protein
MRSLLLIAAAGLAGCSTSPDQLAAENARSEAKLQQQLAGRVAGEGQDCLHTLRAQDMIRIDDDTVLFRDGSRRIYRNELSGACNGLANSNYALVTNNYGGSGRLCRGDIARMMDLQTGMVVGGCAIGEFVPYTRPGA